MKRSIVVAVFLCFVFCQVVWADIFIVANPEVPVRMLTIEEVKNIFIGQKIKWNDDLRVQVTLVKKSEPYSEFSKKYVGKSSTQLENWWRNMVFTGKGSMPKSFTDEAEALKYIAETPGAVGYISTQPEATNIKVLVIKE